MDSGSTPNDLGQGNYYNFLKDLYIRESAYANRGRNGGGGRRRVKKLEETPAEC